MIRCFEVVFNRVLSNSKTHLLVTSETFPNLLRARAGCGWVVARFARPLTRTGRMYPNIPNSGGVDPTASNAENHEQSKTLLLGV
jgi:hypothetical protein